MYRVLHYALTRGDQEYLDLIAGAIAKVDTLEWEYNNLANLKYLLATVLFDKGRAGPGIQGWRQVAALSSVPTNTNFHIEPERARALGHLVQLCLEPANAPFYEHSPLVLDTESEWNDVCLLISSWLRNLGDSANARNALRGLVKKCIALLSDDDPSNDEDAFILLLKTFVADTDSEEDLGAVLYWIKQNNEQLIKAYIPDTYDAKEAHKDDVEVSESLSQTYLARDDSESVDSRHDDFDALDIWFTCDSLTDCSSCKLEIASIHYWYFSRSCPYTTLCWRCYRELRSIGSSSDDASKSPGICDPQHEFFHTGGLLRPSERVPEGKLPLVSSDGERRVIWVEEWRDRLAEKWETSNFEFEGGLSAWCMRVLPEPQKTRWATFFEV